MFTIGLHHFLIVSLMLAAAGVATMLTKRNAIGILIGVELLLNAAAVNFVAFNRYSHGENPAPVVAVVEKSESMAAKPPESAEPPASPATQPADSNIPHSELTRGNPVAVRPASAAPRQDGRMFAIFIVVLAAAEAAIGLAIILNYYNNFSSVDVEKAQTLKG